MATSFASLLKQVLKTIHPDFLFVEPSGMVITKELQSVTAMALRDVRYEIGAFLTLLDGPLFETWWSSRRELLLGQAAGADLLAVSRVDLLDPAELEQMRERLKPYADGIIGLSVFSGLGVDETMRRII